MKITLTQFLCFAVVLCLAWLVYDSVPKLEKYINSYHQVTFELKDQPQAGDVYACLVKENGDMECLFIDPYLVGLESEGEQL